MELITKGFGLPTLFLGSSELTLPTTLPNSKILVRQLRQLELSYYDHLQIA